MADIIERTVVTNPELEHASSSRYTRISTLKISSEKKKETSRLKSRRNVERGSPRTSRSLKRASTSDTSHQFSIRHNDPNRPGIVNRYDLNNAVYTTWANRISWSGVNVVSGMLGIPLKSSTVASDNGGTLWDCEGVIPNVFRAPSSFGRLSVRYRRSASVDRLKSAAWDVRVTNKVASFHHSPGES